MRVHAVRREDELPGEGGLLGIGLRELGSPGELAGLGQLRDFHAERDRRDAIEVGDLLHGARGALQLALEHRRRKRFGEGIDETDVGARVGLPGLAHDAFHGADDAPRVGAAVVDGELDEEKVRPFREDVLLHAERAEIRTGATDGGVDFGETGLRVGLPEMGEGLHAPAVLGGDRAAEVADLDLRSGRLGLAEEIREPSARRDLPGFEEREILVGGLAEDGGAQRQDGEERSHGGPGLDDGDARGFQPIGGPGRKNESPPSFRSRGP